MKIKKHLTYQATGKSYDTFCTNCWRHERFFSGGNSWSPDLCACGCEDTTVWNKMDQISRMIASRKYGKDLEIWQKRNQ